MSQPYRSLEAELHDVFWETEDDGSEVELMAAFLDSHPGRALEIGCGSGRLMLPLISRGFEVEGLELSPDMLAMLRQRADASGIDAVTHEGDMSVWCPEAPYAAVMAPAFTLQLAADTGATLRHWRGFLRPGGGLYVTVFIPFAELEGDFPEGKWYSDHEAYLADGSRALLETRHRLDPENRVLYREHRYSVAGAHRRQHRSKQSLRWFEHTEMLDLLAEAGFSVGRAFTDFIPQLEVGEDAPEEFEGILTYHAIVSE